MTTSDATDRISSSGQPQPVRLKRSIGLTAMVFYGVGTMIGGGIYALLGKIVGLTGVFTPLSLLIAGGLALVTALSFADLSRRYAVSAGAVQYVDAAFGRPLLSRVIGFLVVITGVVSSATLCAATGGFILDLTGWPEPTLIAFTAFTALLLTAIATWGVIQTVTVVAVITLFEAGALLLIIVLSPKALLALPEVIGNIAVSIDQLQGGALLASSFLVFYAFIGFEDMVNMAEETRDAERTLPRAILISVVVMVTLYLGITLVALDLPDYEMLAEAHTPLSLLLPQWRFSALVVGVISILAGLNGALVQLVMASRVLYGMANKGLAFTGLRHVHPLTRTPIRATAVSGFLVLLLAISFPLTGLAVATSFVILVVFAMVNLALAKLLWDERTKTGIGTIPWLPLCGALSCASLLLVSIAYH